MSDRTAELEAAIRAQETLINEAQEEITNYLAKEIEARVFVDRIIRLFDGPQQREAKRWVREALANGERWQSI